MKFKKGDQVLILIGKDRGKKGKILKILENKERVLVEGVNLKKKHIRPKTSGKKGEIVEMPFPLNISNVKIICPKCQKPVRVGEKIEEKLKKRVCKKCKQDI